ncbi:MAG: TolC family protein [Campylobacterales bacterium]|nr:TolC family protein [Campylobacterales bacterium]
MFVRNIFLMGCLSFGLLWGNEEELLNLLSPNNKKIIEYQKKKNELESDKLKNSWVSPVTVSYTKTYSEQYETGRVDTGSFSIGIDQPIFKSGGIYFAIKYAQALQDLNGATIDIAQKEMITNALSMLYNIKKLKLQKAKLALLVKNDEIDIRQKRDSYNNGLIDSSFLDQAILKKNSDETQLLEVDLTIAKLKNDFALLSDKNPDTIKLPKLKLIQAKRYKGQNLELVKKQYEAREKQYGSKITWTKYLPTVSVQARYNDGDLNPMFANAPLKEAYKTYGFTVSMPFSINALKDVESAKVAYLEAQTRLFEKRKEIDNEYKLALTNLDILNKKIHLAQKDQQLYGRLYQLTKNLEKAGEKTKWDTQLMYNSLTIKKYDQQIFAIDRELQLLSLYAKVI